MYSISGGPASHVETRQPSLSENATNLARHILYPLFWLLDYRRVALEAFVSKHINRAHDPSG